jgi:hypothetical protein
VLLTAVHDIIINILKFEQYDLLVVLKVKDEWRFTITVHGEQFVMIPGTSEMLVLSADSLVFQMLRLLTGVLILVKGMDRFGLMMLVVQVMSHRYFHAGMEEWEVITVVTMKTLAYVVMTQVRVNDKKLNMFKAFVKMLQATKLYF